MIFLFLKFGINLVISSMLLVPSDYTTIAAAIEASLSGDTILVSSGLYPEEISFSCKSIALISESGPEFTVINSSPGTGSVVTIEDVEGEGTILEGFTIMGGNWRNGGGVKVINSSPLILNNIIRGNHAVSAFIDACGGGIYVLDSSCLIVGNHIHSNEVCSFGQGWDTAMGGGIYANNSELLVTNNLIEGNWISIGPTSDGYGAGVFTTEDCSGTFYNNVIACNYTEGYQSDGYGIGAAGCSLINNTIAYNDALGINSAAEVTNCIVWGNNFGGAQIDSECWVTFSNVQNEYLGAGNISISPDFVIGTLSSFHLDFPSSPCIDAGNPTLLYFDPEDDPGFAHWPAYGTLQNDMGAYGGPGASYWFEGYTEVAEQSTVEVQEPSLMVEILTNPVVTNPEIILSLGNSSRVEITIFDITGRRFFYQEDIFEVGSHSLLTNVLPPGVYLCCVQSELEVDTIKFTVIR